MRCFVMLFTIHKLEIEATRDGYFHSSLLSYLGDIIITITIVRRHVLARTVLRWPVPKQLSRTVFAFVVGETSVRIRKVTPKTSL